MVWPRGLVVAWPPGLPRIKSRDHPFPCMPDRLERRKVIVHGMFKYYFTMSEVDDSCDDPSTCRPSLPRMKSCLKSPSHSGSATPVESDTDDGTCKKHVAFGTEQVFEADEWDRTPTEISQRLSYESVTRLCKFHILTFGGL